MHWERSRMTGREEERVRVAKEDAVGRGVTWRRKKRRRGGMEG